MKNAIYRYLYRSRYILMGLGIVMFVFLPYFQSGIVTGSDDTFHLIRISSLATALKNGMFPVKFHPTLCRGYGYGVGFFYPNLFLYLPAILIVLGVSQNVAYKIFAFFIMCAIFGTTYYNNGREIYGEKSWGDSVYTFTVQEGTEYCDIPYVYYRGFVAEDTTGKQYKINDNPDTGLARVFLESIDEETIITVTFEGDFYQKCSYLCTIISLAFSMALFYIGRRKNSSGLQQL